MKTKQIILISTYILMVIPLFAYGGDIRGFRELIFGMNLEESQKKYEDLIKVDRLTTGAVLYKRSNDNNFIGELEFNEILYAFENNRFTGISATIKGEAPSVFDSIENAVRKIDITIGSYTKMKGWIESKYGPPANSDIGTCSASSAEWIIGDTRIVINESIFTDGRKFVLIVSSINTQASLGF